MDQISTKIGKLQQLEMELAKRYEMAGSGDVDSAEIFAEARDRAFLNDERLLEAQQLYQLYELRRRRATYLRGLEAISRASMRRTKGRFVFIFELRLLPLGPCFDVIVIYPFNRVAHDPINLSFISFWCASDFHPKALGIRSANEEH
ncbi:hypothetical protein F5146DRAFT_997580 [Armillaria mellea]|nr:hypothetical protein F5146DRAFT_997580 [Armillaria mellea]